MKPASKRPWFQLHLSTLVALSLLAGVAMLANVHPAVPRYFAGALAQEWLSPVAVEHSETYGWPLVLYPDLSLRAIPDGPVAPVEQPRIVWFAAGMDALFWLMLFASTGSYFEMRARRKRQAAEGAETAGA